jgi:hypothetical protein
MLQNKEHQHLYPSPFIMMRNKTRMMIWVGKAASMAKITNAPRILVGKIEGKRRIMNSWTPLKAQTFGISQKELYSTR